MSKSKSLGSSPIGYSSSNNERYSFIPDLGVSDSKKEHQEQTEDTVSEATTKDRHPSKIHRLLTSGQFKPEKEQAPKEKKIVSYYLEKDLVKRLKEVADHHGIYYSTLVSDAISSWIKTHDYN